MEFLASVLLQRLGRLFRKCRGKNLLRSHLCAACDSVWLNGQALTELEAERKMMKIAMDKASDECMFEVRDTVLL